MQSKAAVGQGKRAGALVLGMVEGQALGSKGMRLDLGKAAWWWLGRGFCAKNHPKLRVIHQGVNPRSFLGPWSLCGGVVRAGPGAPPVFEG